MHLLDHRRIARKTAVVELLHLPRQVLHVFRGLRIALHHLLKLVQLAHALLIGALGIGGIAGGVKLWWPLRGLAVAVIAGVDVAPDSAVRAASAAVAYVTALAVALAGAVSRLLADTSVPPQVALCELARLLPGLAASSGLLSTAVGLTRLIAVLVALLAGLIILALLSVAARLTALAILALLPAVTAA
jgi:hypothetical protein